LKEKGNKGNKGNKKEINEIKLNEILIKR